jgi:hypothetical protein
MKVFTLAVLAGAILVGGCASTPEGTKPQVASSERPYTPTGTLIARKGQPKADPQDLQSFQNNRTMNNGVNNSQSNSL